MEFYDHRRSHFAFGGKPPSVIYRQRIQQTQPDQQAQRAPLARGWLHLRRLKSSPFKRPCTDRVGNTFFAATSFKMALSSIWSDNSLLRFIVRQQKWAESTKKWRRFEGSDQCFPMAGCFQGAAARIRSRHDSCIARCRKQSKWLGSISVSARTHCGTALPPTFSRTGTDIRVIHVLFGHSKLETTALYAKVSTRTIHAVAGPLDRLMALMEGKSPDGCRPCHTILMKDGRRCGGTAW